MSHFQKTGYLRVLGLCWIIVYIPDVVCQKIFDIVLPYGTWHLVKISWSYVQQFPRSHTSSSSRNLKGAVFHTHPQMSVSCQKEQISLIVKGQKLLSWKDWLNPSWEFPALASLKLNLYVAKRVSAILKWRRFRENEQIQALEGAQRNTDKRIKHRAPLLPFCARLYKISYGRCMRAFV